MLILIHCIAINKVQSKYHMIFTLEYTQETSKPFKKKIYIYIFLRVIYVSLKIVTIEICKSLTFDSFCMLFCN